MDVPGPESISHESLAGWCLAHLGSPPRSRFFEVAHLSVVIGVELMDGRQVVIKVRDPSERLAACAEVQSLLHTSGFPCADVLAGPAAFDDRVATAESYLPPGDPPPSPPPAGLSAGLFLELVARTPPPEAYPALSALLPWVGWDHGGDGLWPAPDDLEVDLNVEPNLGALDDAAQRVRRRLGTVAGPSLIAHMDWEAQNLAWRGREPVAVHDWDSLVIRPESTAAGAAAAVYPSYGAVVFATIEQTDAFLRAYCEHRHLSDKQVEEAWAAGAWVLAYNAKKEGCGGGTGYLGRAELELEERLRRAGA